MSKGMKERQILAVIKEVGREPYVEPLFENTLEGLQAAVGGLIETVTTGSDSTLIVNEEGKLLGLPYNVTVCGARLHGTVIAVGVKGDEFCSLKASIVPFVMQMLKGDKADDRA